MKATGRRLRAAIGTALGATLAAVFAAVLAASASAQQFTSSVQTVPDSSTRLALRDVNGDGRRDLLAVAVDGFSLHVLSADGTFPEAPSGTLAWPSDTVGWNLADFDGDGVTEIVLLVDGSRALAVHADEAGAFTAPRELLTDAAGFLPRGIRRVNIVRDVDGDDRPDLVLPGAGRFRIHLQRDGGFAEPLSVGFEPSLTIELGDPSRVDARFAEQLSIPWFTLRDLDGDGHTDLVSETPDEAFFHIADPELPAAPTWRLDLRELRREAGEPQGIDLDDLLANVEPQVNWKVADLDGNPPQDLVLQQGGKFSVFLGGSRGPKLDAPDQVLKASGNVLYFLLRDVDESGSSDLQILRAETVSLGDALRLLVVPGSLDFDIFTYRNEAGAFSRKPSTKATISLRIPALLGFIDTAKEISDDYKEKLLVPAQPATLDADGLRNDIVDVRDGALAIWKNRVPADFKPSLKERYAGFDIDELLEEYSTRKLDQLDDGGTLSIGIDDIRKLLVTPGWNLRQAVGDAEPDLTLPLDAALLAAPAGATAGADAGADADAGTDSGTTTGATAGAPASPDANSPATSSPDIKLRVEDIDGDGIDDIIVVGRNALRQQVVQFLVGG